VEQIAAGDLVKVSTAGPQIDGIVFDLPSASKVVVAVMDRDRGPVMRTVPRTALTERCNSSCVELLTLFMAPHEAGAGRGNAARDTSARRCIAPPANRRVPW